MRISGGQFKGKKTVVSRRVFSGKSDRTELRPTSSKVREALFDILRNDISDASFLDLYAGTGTVGLEAVSRGAAKVFFVESDAVRCKAVRNCIAKMGLEDKTFVYKQSAVDFLKNSLSSGIEFDIIFADPPYASEEIIDIFHLIEKGVVLKNGGCFIIEHSSKVLLPGDTGSLRMIKKYRYGDTMLSLYGKVK